MTSAPEIEVVEDSPLQVQVAPDDIYYFHAVFFQAEDRIFQVPSYHFARNERFLDAVAPQNQPPGIGETSEETPLRLEGVSKVDFGRLLEVMHPLDSVMALGGPTRTKDGWISILRLATKWDFLAFRNLAISELEHELKDPIERILLTRAFNVPRWLYLGYEALVTRDAVISLEEAESIGYPTTIRLFQVREEIRGGMQDLPSTSDAIRKKFCEELPDVGLTKRRTIRRVGRK